MKTCTKCGVEKPVSEYYKKQRGRYGVRAECKACVAVSGKKYYEENRDRVMAYHKKYYEENRDQARAYKKKFREENRDRLKAKDKKYYEENRDQARAYQKKYCKENPEKRRASKHNRRARKASLISDLTEQQWLETLNNFGEKCAYCGDTWEHQDHFIPVRLGGGYTKGNIVPACASCNLSKNSKPPEEWLSEKPEIYERVTSYLYA